MEDHETENRWNGEQVKLDVTEPGVRRRSSHTLVHFSKGKSLPGVRMAFATGSGKITLGNHGTRVAGRKNIVNSVAARAIRHRLGAGLRGQAVVAVLIAGNAVGRKIEARLKLLVPVAARTRIGSNIGHVDGRVGIAGGQDVVLPVTTVQVGASKTPAATARPWMLSWN